MLQQEGIDIIGITSNKNDGRTSSVWSQDAINYQQSIGGTNLNAGPMFWGIVEPDEWSGNVHNCPSGILSGVPGAFRGGTISNGDTEYNPQDYYLVHPKQDGDTENYVTVYFVMGGQGYNACNYIGNVSTSAVMCKSGEPCYASEVGNIIYCFHNGQCSGSASKDTLIGWSKTKDSDTVQYKLGSDISALVTETISAGESTVKLYPVIVDNATYCHFNDNRSAAVRAVTETPVLARTSDNQCHATCYATDGSTYGWETWPLDPDNPHYHYSVTCE